MKVFIVFIGLFLIFVSFLVYHADIGRYAQAQTYVKAMAEECAAGAALYVNEEEYSDASLVFDSDEGQKYAAYIIEESKKKMPFPKDSIITYDINFQDDLLGYHEEDGTSGEIPSVTVRIDVETIDMFRLPFLYVDKVSRMAKYELPDS